MGCWTWQKAQAFERALFHDLLADPVLAFRYCGDERSQNRRCFAVQAGKVQSQSVVLCDVSCKPYDVAVWFDWDAKRMSVFIDGAQHLDNVPFEADQPIRYAAIYNWRSGARTAFSELLCGETCPFPLPSS